MSDKLPLTLNTNGTVEQLRSSDTLVGWAPDQAAHAGEYLTTDGTSVSWSAIREVSTGGNAAQVLTTDGTNYSWGDVPTEVPDQATHAGEYLTTNGTTLSWSAIREVPTGGTANQVLTNNGAGYDWADDDDSVVITSATNLYVATTGNDTTGDGSVSNPWATVDKALAVVGDWVLRAEVNIYIVEGDYTATTEALTIDHIDGANIKILGDYETDTMTLSGSSDGGTYRDNTFTTTDASKYVVGDQVLVFQALGGTNPSYTIGTQTVQGISGTSITLRHSEYSVAAPSGAVVVNVSIPKVKWGRTITIRNPLGMLSGIVNARNATSTFYYFHVQGNGPVKVALQHCIFHNTNAANTYGYWIVRYNSYTSCYAVGCRNLHWGMFSYSSSLEMTYSGCTHCDNGYRLYGGGVAKYTRIHIIGSTSIGIYHQFQSCSSIDAAAVAMWNNSTDASPANGTEGNQNSWMQY